MVMLKRVGVMSVAKIIAVLSAIVGLIEGIVFAGLGSIMSGSMLGGILSATPIGTLGVFGLTAIIIFPVSGAISGFIGGAIGAFLYNLVAARIGGIEMDLVRVQAALTPAPTQPATIPTTAQPIATAPVSDAAPTRYCSHCAARISSTAMFCGSCGAKQT
jgi:TM2 domain-containing membrane protein YozV